VTQKRAARRPKGPGTKNGDREKALEVLATVGVTPTLGWAQVVQAGLLFKNAQAAANERDAAEARVQLDYRAIAQALGRVKLATEAGRRLRDCFLRDLRGETLTLNEIRAGKTRAPILKPLDTSRGRPVDVGIERTILGFEAVHGWNWQVCAAAAFLSGVSTYDYEAIKKSFRDWDRRHRKPGTVGI
jgi:hypothetical protein